MLVQLILSDLYRYCRNTKLSSFLKTDLFNRGFNFSVWLRLSASKSWIGKLAYPIFYYKKKNKVSISTAPQKWAMACSSVMGDL